MKKIVTGLMLISSVFVLSACVSNKPTDFGEVVVEQSDNLIVADKDNIFQVALPKDYLFNDQAEIESISYGHAARETYVLAFAEPKTLLPAKTIQEYFALVTPALDDIKVEELASDTIPNPKGYTVKDYKVTGSYGGVSLVWYQRILENNGYFAQVNSWTLDTYESQNKQELFDVISSFEWKDGANTVSTGAVENDALSGTDEVMIDDITTGVVSE